MSLALTISFLLVVAFALLSSFELLLLEFFLALIFFVVWTFGNKMSNFTTFVALPSSSFSLIPFASSYQSLEALDEHSGIFVIIIT